MVEENVRRLKQRIMVPQDVSRAGCVQMKEVPLAFLELSFSLKDNANLTSGWEINSLQGRWPTRYFEVITSPFLSA